uniref:Uncharacterized protein n=1 Tax=Picea glauca TaxID=3330 RepID=A0A117NG63_PICGL|nr:hypothetical protein ABT39_MTgene1802 [Picea glauca]QHR86357.1 hypothetical protein Q903MT_gene356 [Picea sitchensis]
MKSIQLCSSHEITSISTLYPTSSSALILILSSPALGLSLGTSYSSLGTSIPLTSSSTSTLYVQFSSVQDRCSVKSRCSKSIDVKSPIPSV